MGHLVIGHRIAADMRADRGARGSLRAGTGHVRPDPLRTMHNASVRNDAGLVTKDGF